MSEKIYFRDNYRSDNDSYYISITEISDKIPESSKPIFTSSNGWKIYRYKPIAYLSSKTSTKFIDFSKKEVYLTYFYYYRVLWHRLDNNFRDRFWEVSFVLNEFKHYCQNKFK